jgi:hypothetical protein
MATRRRIQSVLPAALSTLSLLVCTPLSAQATPLAVMADTVLAPAAASTNSPVPPAPHTGRAILGGALGSAIGVGAGAAVGYAMATCSQGEWFCGLGEAAVGGLVGSTVGSTLGANLGVGSGHKATFGSTFVGAAVGVLVGIGGAYLGANVNPDGPGALIGFSVGQGLVAGLFAARGR